MLVWAVIGALMLFVLIFCARVMRKGLTTLDEDRKQYLERINEGKRQIEEDCKNITAQEHLMVVKAAIDDLLRLDGYPAGYSFKQNGNKFEVSTPRGQISVEMIMHESSLRSASKTLHGKSMWHLTAFDHQEDYPDISSLMRDLNKYLHSDTQPDAEPDHLARRLNHTK